MHPIIISIIILSLSLFFVAQVSAIDTSREEKICSEIGFKQKTEDYANCVLEILSRDDSQRSSSSNNRSSPLPEAQTDPDAALCMKYGFKQKTENYNECRLKISLAKQEAQQRQAEYNEQKRQYDAQVAAIEKEQDRRRRLRLLDLSQRLLSGQNITDSFRGASGLPPLIKPLGFINQETIVMPGGRMVTCTTTGGITNCF